ADVAGALALADHQVGDIHHEALGDLIRHALDFDRARDDLEQPALHFDAFGFAAGPHGNRNAQALGEIDALEIGVQQVAPDRAHLIVDHHNRAGSAAVHSQAED